MASPTSFITHLERLIQFLRAREWWDSKIPFALCAALSLAVYQDRPTGALLLPLLLIVTSGIAGAIYASVFNDLLDLREDRLAGKSTVVMGFSRRGRALTHAAIQLLLLVQTLALRPYPIAQGCFLGIWALYTAYSLPPVRLKERGAAGVLCIALGEHTLAALLALSLASTSGASLPLVFTILVIVWGFALGCRSILWHQLCDYDNDRRTGTQTLGARLPYTTLRRLGERIVFPLEVIALLAVLVLCRSPLGFWLFGVATLFEWICRRQLGMKLVIVAPQPWSRFALLEFYQVFWPLALLIPGATRDTRALGLLVAYALLFPAPFRRLAYCLRLCLRPYVPASLKARVLRRSYRRADPPFPGK